MRLFIAIDIDFLNNYFFELQNSLPKATFFLPKTFHLTLKFLGNVDEKYLDKIKTKLKEIKFEKFSTSLSNVGVFPKESFINVVWIGLEPEENIIKLQEEIDNQLKFLFKRNIKFKPHITIARVKYVQDKNEFIKNLKSINIDKKEIEVTEFKLIKSTLTKEGPVYEVLESYSLE